MAGDPLETLAANPPPRSLLPHNHVLSLRRRFDSPPLQAPAPSPIRFPTTSSASPVSPPSPSRTHPHSRPRRLHLHRRRRDRHRRYRSDSVPRPQLPYLVIDATSVVLRISDYEIHPDHVVFDAEDEILVLAFDEAIPVGKAVLAIGFAGVLYDHMRGFGRSKYEMDGIKRNMTVTQFEPVEARRCFPCWDEPALEEFRVG